jgi:hypothetical protein
VRLLPLLLLEVLLGLELCCGLLLFFLLSKLLGFLRFSRFALLTILQLELKLLLACETRIGRVIGVNFTQRASSFR